MMNAEQYAALQVLEKTDKRKRKKPTYDRENRSLLITFALILIIINSLSIDVFCNLMDLNLSFHRTWHG